MEDMSQHAPPAIEAQDALNFPAQDEGYTSVGSDQPSYSARPSLSTVSLTFLEKLKMRFGEESEESVMVHKTLGDFSTGRISKKETYSFILDTLDNQADLETDLMDIINHEDARWGPGDFDLPEVSLPQPTLLQTTPFLLQPAHQPSIRLPSLSAPWHTNATSAQPIDFAALDEMCSYRNDEQSCGGEYSFAQHASQDWPSFTQPDSPLPHEPATTRFSIPEGSNVQYQLAQPYTFPGIPSPDLPHYTTCQTEPTPVYPDQWENEQLVQQLTDPQSFGATIPQQMASYNYPEWSQFQHGVESADFPNLNQPYAAPPIPSPSSEPMAPTGLPTDMTLNAVSNIHSVGDMLPPLLGRGCERPVTPNMPQPTIGRYLTPRPSSAREMLAPEPISETKEYTNGQGANKGGGPGPFIHGLCGKGFTTRSKVKKHHWGIKNNDLQTTTGCWAKHDKPNVNWDDHPSCREPPHSAWNRTNHTHIEPASVDRKAPVVPAMVPESKKLLSRIRLQQDLFELAAASYAPTAALMRLQPTARRFSPRPSMDDLLTVVNAEVSSIEAPKPTGRNDSIISNLNAQAEREEHQYQSQPQTQSFYNNDHGATSHYRGHPLSTPASAQGLDMFGFAAPQTQVDPASSSTYYSRNGYASSAVSPTDVQPDSVPSPTPINYGDGLMYDNGRRGVKHEREQDDVCESPVVAPEGKRHRF